MNRTLTYSESLFITGRSFVTGAHAIAKSEMRACYNDDVRFVIPCMMLIGHAIEVYLKAWLAFHGYTEVQLRRAPFGHDLRKLYDEARIKGLPEPKMPPQQSLNDLVESYEYHHGDFTLRYPQDGWQFEVPKLDLLFDILAVLDGVVAMKIGMSIPANLDWSITSAEDFRLPQAVTRRENNLGPPCD